MQQFLILEYLYVEGGVNFWEIIKIRLNTAEKHLTNLQKIVIKSVKNRQTSARSKHKKRRKYIFFLNKLQPSSKCL